VKLHFNYQKIFHLEAAGLGREFPFKTSILADLKPRAASELGEALSRDGRTLRRMTPSGDMQNSKDTPFIGKRLPIVSSWSRQAGTAMTENSD
jgi:hypothetical protein